MEQHHYYIKLLLHTCQRKFVLLFFKMCHVLVSQLEYLVLQIFQFH